MTPTPEPVAEAGGVSLVCKTCGATDFRKSNECHGKPCSWSAPAGDGEAEKLANAIALATGCDGNGGDGYIVKIERKSMGFWRKVAAALRRAQPPQPTGDVEGLGGLTDTEREYIASALSLAAAHKDGNDKFAIGLANNINAMAGIIGRLNSRIAVTAQELFQEQKTRMLYEGYVTKLENALEFVREFKICGADGDEVPEDSLHEIRKVARAVLSPTEPAGRGG